MSKRAEQPEAPELTFRVLHDYVSGQRDGRDYDYPRSSVVPESAFGADVERLLECEAIEMYDGEPESPEGEDEPASE